MHTTKLYGSEQVGERYGLCGCCRGRVASFQRFLWMYEGELPRLRTKITPIYQWSLGGELIATHDGIADAARMVNCDPSTINNCVHGLQRQAVGFQWTRTSIPPPTARSVNDRRRQVQHTPSGEIFESVTEAARRFGHSVGHVSACCRGGRAHIGGDMFSYVDDVQCVPME